MQEPDALLAGLRLMEWIFSAGFVFIGTMIYRFSSWRQRTEDKLEFLQKWKDEHESHSERVIAEMSSSIRQMDERVRSIKETTTKTAAQVDILLNGHGKT